jgi:hypothetical protein
LGIKVRRAVAFIFFRRIEDLLSSTSTVSLSVITTDHQGGLSRQNHLLNVLLPLHVLKAYFSADPFAQYFGCGKGA